MKKFLPMIALFISFSAIAQDNCPIAFGTEDYLNKVASLISQTESCYEANQIAEACALGASGDVFIAGTAIKRCERDIPRMSKKDAETYAALNAKCDKKYANMQGTMYMSMNAFCHLRVTSLFNDLLTEVE